MNNTKDMKKVVFCLAALAWMSVVNAQTGEGGNIHIQGVDEGTQVNVYSINGTQAGSAISQSGAASFFFEQGCFVI